MARSNASYDRWDLVILSNKGIASVVTGTPAASPALPTVPANYMAIWGVIVHAGDVSASSFDYSTIGDIAPTA